MTASTELSIAEEFALVLLKCVREMEKHDLRTPSFEEARALLANFGFMEGVS